MALQHMKVYPVTSERWPDLEQLFGERGACCGCWCMFWRLKRSEFDHLKSDGRKRALKQIIRSGEIPGILAYVGNEPIAWCSIGPRETYGALERSRTLKRIDQEPVWSVVCFFVARPFRRYGLTGKLLQAAVEHAQARGAKIVEGYPIDPKRPISSGDLYTGAASVFRKAGFIEVKREPRLVMRYFIEENPS